MTAGQIIKAKLVEMAAMGELPMDMTQLDASIFDDILTEAGYVFPDWEYEAGNYLVDDNNYTVKEQVMLIVEHKKRIGEGDSTLIDDVDGIDVWISVERRFTINEFLELINYVE